MKDIIIIGCTSNICKIRVFNNLNKLLGDISKIFCCSRENMTSDDFRDYVENEASLENNKIHEKIHYIACEYNYADYKSELSKLIHDDTIIYVSTPPLCYGEILCFFNELTNESKLVLEKPLSINYAEFEGIKGKIENNPNIAMIDHFICKRDILNVVETYKNSKVTDICIRFLYADDVEDRLGYFDKTGFFIDMFQSHFLSIIYLLIGKRTNEMLTGSILSNERKQYISYGGANEVDTYFYVEFESDDLHIRVEAGKAMERTVKELTINHTKYKINNYNDEYEIFFKGIMDDSAHNMLPQQELFWKITELVTHDIGKSLDYYAKNEFIGIIEEQTTASREDMLTLKNLSQVR